ncbi:MAG: nitronate monooxygenase [Deltaproteobacteria bacterium]|nr:nitronate monooxygenase [Deltaproteobacteria bacterium]
MIQTKITEMFGNEHPIICGGMMWLCKPPLCAAISNAGGMGNLTAANYETEEAFRAAIHETRTLTDKPFTVNVTILPSVRITEEHYKMYLRVCAEEQVAALEISGMPIDKACGMETIELLKKAGVKLFHKVGSVRHARHAESVGYDGIYAAGIEEGGHPLDDDVTTMLLTPRIKASVSIPVVTVGGIADGHTMAAALMLGADAVMMASRFIATKECQVHENIKQELIRRQENDTTLICKSLNLQGRALKNKTVECVLEEEACGSGFEKIYPFIAGERCIKAWETGDVDLAPMYVGQSIGLIEDIPSCSELVTRITAQAEARIGECQAMIRHN